MKRMIILANQMIAKVSKWLTILASIGIALLMIVNFIDIVGTKAFNKSLPGALDISEELMVFLTLLPLAFVALEKGHIRITLLEDRFIRPVRNFFHTIQYSIAAFITGFITWRAFIQFQRAYSTAQLKEGINIPVWPSNLTVTISFGFLTLAWLLLLAKIPIKELKS